MFADLPTIKRPKVLEKGDCSSGTLPHPRPTPVEMGRLEKQSQEFQCTLPGKARTFNPQKHTFS